MQTNTIIEDLVASELKPLCNTCVHRDECVYYRTSLKAVIQCELFELDQSDVSESYLTISLCTTCDHAKHCTLPGRKRGVWRCNEFS